MARESDCVMAEDIRRGCGGFAAEGYVSLYYHFPPISALAGKQPVAPGDPPGSRANKGDVFIKQNVPLYPPAARAATLGKDATQDGKP